METETYAHIEIAEDGIPTVTGTHTKVVGIILDRLAHNWDVDEIQRHHPHLDLAQAYSAWVECATLWPSRTERN